MPELIPCYICGVVPEIQRSYSSRLISHRCRDFHSMWGSKSQVVAEWNNSNSLENKESTEPTTNSKSMPLPEDAVVDRCKRFEECPASGKGHAGCYSSVGCFL